MLSRSIAGSSLTAFSGRRIFEHSYVPNTVRKVLYYQCISLVSSTILTMFKHAVCS